MERSGRYGKVISNTVETWARRSGAAHLRDGSYKPLVFGGTYPIDAPASPPEPPPAATARPAPAPAPPPPPPLDPQAHRRELRRTIERSLDKFEAMLARRGPAPARDDRRAAFSRRVVETFDIDEPMNLADPPVNSLPREKDAKYYVTGPKTFDIDEPVSFI